MQTHQGVIRLERWRPTAQAPLACIACVTRVSVMADGADIAALARGFARLTPRIERHTHALVLDLTGCERLVLAAAASAVATTTADLSDHSTTGYSSVLSNPHTRVAQALSRVARSIVEPSSASIAPIQVGVASTRTLAWLAATGPILTPPSICWRTLTPAQIASLPLTTLGSLPDLEGSGDVTAALTVLEQSGIRTFGQLARLSTDTLHRRFGPLGAALALLAAGHDLAPLQLVTPERWLSGRLHFHVPIPAERIPRTFIPLAQQLAAILSQHQLAAGVVGIVLQPDGGPARHAQRHLGQPITSPAALLDHAQRLLARLTNTDGIGDADRHETYHFVRLRVGNLHVAVRQQTPLWALERPDRQIQQARRAQLRTAICSRAQRNELAGLLRITRSAPDAVLPEDRFTLRPVPVTEGAR